MCFYLHEEFPGENLDKVSNILLYINMQILWERLYKYSKHPSFLQALFLSSRNTDTNRNKKQHVWFFNQKWEIERGVPHHNYM